MNTGLPLEGITAVELGSSLAAPYAGLILAEMGAEVFKVERPDGGDAARDWGPKGPYGFSILFETFNRNKKSITIDFTNREELARLRRLILERADVVLQNLRPGVVEKLHLDGPSLIAKNPNLIYCNVGAFGGVGKMSRLPGYDPLMQAFSGICHITGPEDGEPCRAGVSIIDMGTGMWAAMGIMARLVMRKNNGIGGQVNAALFETAIAWMSMPMANIINTGKSPGRYGMRGPGNMAPNRGYMASDGMLIIAAGTNYLFHKLCQALGQPLWAEDERFNSAEGRAENEVEMSRLISEVIRTETRAHWMDVLDRAGVPNAPVHTAVEALNHPHTKDSGVIQASADGASPQVALPLKFDNARLPYRHRAPKLGEHNNLLK